ncbi:hypothetical protein F5141DRAFT_739042 [Pisolithus sp. B1]|nr:hypothetical protein F5141DRAFT_739042 [Pisolithus sp. B1]
MAYLSHAKRCRWRYLFWYLYNGKRSSDDGCGGAVISRSTTLEVCTYILDGRVRRSQSVLSASGAVKRLCSASTPPQITPWECLGRITSRKSVNSKKKEKKLVSGVYHAAASLSFFPLSSSCQAKITTVVEDNRNTTLPKGLRRVRGDTILSSLNSRTRVPAVIPSSHNMAVSQGTSPSLLRRLSMCEWRVSKNTRPGRNDTFHVFLDNNPDRGQLILEPGVWPA